MSLILGNWSKSKVLDIPKCDVHKVLRKHGISHNFPETRKHIRSWRTPGNLHPSKEDFGKLPPVDCRFAKCPATLFRNRCAFCSSNSGKTIFMILVCREFMNEKEEMAWMLRLEWVGLSYWESICQEQPKARDLGFFVYIHFDHLSGQTFFSGCMMCERW